MWYPKAVRRPITRHDTPMHRYDMVVLHVTAVEATSQYGYFSRPGNPTSHFHIARDGTVEQYVDTKYRAPAQLNGNYRCLGIETQGVGAGEWEGHQWVSLIDLVKWCCSTHNIPMALAPNSKPTSRGIAPHRWGIDPYRVDGGELWSSAYAKACPGSDRVRQLNRVVQEVAGMAFTAAQEAELKEFLANLRAAGSSVDFVKPVVDLVRAFETTDAAAVKAHLANHPGGSGSVTDEQIRQAILRILNS